MPVPHGSSATRVVAALLLLAAFAVRTAADGCLLRAAGDRLLVHPEEHQICAINFQNGEQRMLISVQPGTTDGPATALWIFPVPAPPGQTSVEIVGAFPQMNGGNVISQARDRATACCLLAGVHSQVVNPLGFPIAAVIPPAFGVAATPGLFRGKTHGITVHESIERLGLSLELVSTDDPAALPTHLAEKGMRLIPDDFTTILGDYVAKDYCFIICWISDLQEFDRAQRGRGTVSVFAQFPADRPFFPMRPTAIYGDHIVPIEIFVLDFVTPIIDPQIAPRSVVAYEIGHNIRRQLKDAPALGRFFEGRDLDQSLRVTHIEARIPANQWKSDLWFKLEAPRGVHLADGFLRPIVTATSYAIFFSLASAVAFLIAIRIIYGDAMGRIPKLVLISQANWLTVAGLGFAMLSAFPRFQRGKTTLCAALAISLIGPMLVIGLSFLPFDRTNASDHFFELLISFLFVALPLLGQTALLVRLAAPNSRGSFAFGVCLVSFLLGMSPIVAAFLLRWPHLMPSLIEIAVPAAFMITPTMAALVCWRCEPTEPRKQFLACLALFSFLFLVECGAMFFALNQPSSG